MQETDADFRFGESKKHVLNILSFLFHNIHLFLQKTVQEAGVDFQFDELKKTVISTISFLVHYTIILIILCDKHKNEWKKDGQKQSDNKKISCYNML